MGAGGFPSVAVHCQDGMPPQGQGESAPMLRAITDRTAARLIARLELGSEPTAAKVAREWIRRGLMSESWPTPAMDDATVVISELVTNAVRHAKARLIVCHLLSYYRRPLIMVWDGDPSPPRIRRRRAFSRPEDIDALSFGELESGRGLVLVEEKSHMWGYRPHMFGKVVWSILKVPADSSSEIDHTRSIEEPRRGA